jgi:hypothetical protein
MAKGPLSILAFLWQYFGICKAFYEKETTFAYNLTIKITTK